MKDKYSIKIDFKKLREAHNNTSPSSGWIRFMRESLKMKVKDLAARTQLSSQTISETEKRETEGRITIQNLQKMARALECELVYGFLPKKEIDEIVKVKAYQKARNLLFNSEKKSKYANENLSEEEQINILAQELIKKGDVW